MRDRPGRTTRTAAFLINLICWPLDRALTRWAAGLDFDDEKEN